NLTVLITHDEVWIDLSDLIGDQPKLRRIGLVALVLKRHRFQRDHRFTGFIHRFDLLLEASCGRGCAELVTIGHNDWQRRGADRSSAIDVLDPGGVWLVLTRMTDTNDATGPDDVDSGSIAQGRVELASGVVIERRITVRGVEVAGGFRKKPTDTGGRIAGAGGVALECRITSGSVSAAGGVAKERERSIGRVGD